MLRASLSSGILGCPVASAAADWGIFFMFVGLGTAFWSWIPEPSNGERHIKIYGVIALIIGLVALAVATKACFAIDE